MSAAEDDTELRDLLLQNLENNGVLNKLKAEIRAAVFLAMEEQDKVENKTPLVNENLKKCLNTKDGRLVASLIIDFLHVFSLDFSLAVFLPEINSLNGLDTRDHVCREFGFSDSEVNRNAPLLLELVKRGRHKDRAAILTESGLAAQQGDKPAHLPKELSPKQIADARKKFDFYDKDRSGSVAKENVKSVLADLFPAFNKNMLERFVADELRAADKSFSRTLDFQEFLGLYRRLFAQCRSVVAQDSGDGSHPAGRVPDDKTSPSPASKIPRYKGHKHRGQEQRAAKSVELNRSDSSAFPAGKVDVQPGSRHSEAPGDKSSSSSLKKALDLELEVEEDPDDGDSFFDDPLPKPQKTYGWKPEPPGARGRPAGSLSEPDVPKPAGASSVSEPSHSRTGSSSSREKGLRDLRDKTGSLHLDDDVEYDDDFNSHRSDLSKSELSIGEELEEVSIEGPENSEKFDESTQDLSVSQLSQSHGADYMEEVA
ncbi:centrosomal protein 43 isoform X2 [Myripristis murdjan]|uniref:Centrosomal protein 43 n=1 Tax=Myripristis murdjan TaxID=586833 RepID=A0A668A6W6_9TELE|nr:FGFR1 oncogene partner isoform X2 [Myripristis murdjan]